MDSNRAAWGARDARIFGAIMVVTYYVIRDPDTNCVAYIGQTIHSEVRGKQHLNPSVSVADGSKGQIVSKWIKNLAAQGKVPTYEVIGHLDLSAMSKPVARIVRSAVEKTLIEGFADDAALRSRHVLNVVHNPYRDRSNADMLVLFIDDIDVLPVKSEKGFIAASRLASISNRLSKLTK